MTDQHHPTLILDPRDPDHHHTLANLDTIRELLNEHGLDPDHIQRVEIYELNGTSYGHVTELLRDDAGELRCRDHPNPDADPRCQSTCTAATRTYLVAFARIPPITPEPATTSDTSD